MSHYRPEIDGLRGIAVLGVLLFHFELGLPGGFVGVDIFFVISGFLITGIIRRSTEGGNFSLTDFWKRRVKRIFPALYCTVFATIAVGYWLLLPDELEELGESSLWQAVFCANIFFWSESGYFDGPAEFKPLLHTWSLAVEEQFYLILPCVMIAFQRYSRSFLFRLFLLAALISFAGSIYGVAFHRDATFFLLPTRAWELLAGSLIALRNDRTQHRDSWLGYAGLLGIFIPYLFYSQETSFPGIAAVPPVLGTAAIIVATNNKPTFLVTRVLAWKPLVGVGLISYSLYLWHWPAIVYSKLYFAENKTLAISSALVLSLIISVLSWKFIEQPFRRPSLLKSSLKTGVFAATCIVLAIASGHVLTQTEGLKSRFTGNVSVLLEDITWTGSAYRTPRDTLIERDMLAYDLFPSLGAPPQASDQQLDLFVWGDSHGMALIETIDEVASELGLIGKAYVRGSTVPLPLVTCTAHSDARQQLIISNQLLELLKQQPPRQLVLIARWSQLIKTDTSPPEHHPMELEFHESGQDSSRTIADSLVSAFKTLENLCEEQNISLWIIQQIPETAEKSPSANLARFLTGRTHMLSDKKRSREYHQTRQYGIENVFAQLQTGPIRFVNPAEQYFDDNGLTVNYEDGRSCYRDDDHVTRWGANKARESIFEVLNGLNRK